MTVGPEHDPPPGHDHWQDHARNWSYFGPPLRPHPDDVRIFEQAILGCERATGSALRAVLLGVTRELAGCRWPQGTRLVAVDRSPAMIHALWPGPGTPADARVICGDWRAMPLGDHDADVVVGDGCYAIFPFPDGFFDLSREVRRVLRPGGLFVIRVYLRPDRAETVGDIARDLEEGRIGNVHAMKWRLAAALHGSTEEGGRLADIWEAWRGLRPLAERLGPRPGWLPEQLATVEAYRGVDTRYWFPTMQDFRSVASRDFDERLCATGRYELAERCPIFVLAKRAS